MMAMAFCLSVGQSHKTRDAERTQRPPRTTDVADVSFLRGDRTSHGPHLR